jgi:predicted TIM-barrel fold metal-dependent hydrolase
MEYRVISTDDHLQEPPDTWTSRMSKAKWGDRIPHIERDSEGLDHWHIYGKPSVISGIASVRGIMPPGKPPLTWEEVPRKSYVPAERIEAMDEDGVDVHTFFGNITGAAGNTFSDPDYDEEFRLDCIRAYNDFQIDEWAAPHPGRFITLANLPMWDVDAAVAELQRMARRGVNGISFAFPEQWGYKPVSDPYWDPLWAAAQDADLSINFHVGSGASMGLKRLPAFTPKSHLIFVALTSTKAITANIEVMTTLLFSPIMPRFPRLKIVSSESGIGWVPYLLEVADHQWEAQDLRHHGMPDRPSEMFHRQCYVNFWFEELGPKQLRNLIGIDNIMWESDFPHGTGTYPNSRKYIEQSMSSFTPEERRKVLVDNPRRVFNL